MKKNSSIVLILFASLMYTLSYASDDSNSEEKAFKLSEVDTPPRVTKAIPPIYPKKKTIDGLILTEGRVILKFIVTKDGRVSNPEIIEAVPEGIFEASAIGAVKNYRFTPATKNGEPVDCIAKLPIMFVLPGVNTPYDVYQAAQKGLKFLKVGEYDNAVKAFDEAIKISKKYGPGYSGRGMAYMYLKEYEKAIVDFDMAIKKSGKTALNYKLRGEVFNALKDYNTAIKDFDRAIKIEPEMLEAYFERGNAFRNLEKYIEAIADYTKVIELDKNYLQAYNNRAVAYNKLNDSENMCLDLKKACNLGDCRGLELAQKAGKCSADVAGN
ncbi:MAG: TonB family protein [Desulfatiglans sp.]|nr:TonB family protein [Desulfatiglans sp.]